MADTAAFFAKKKKKKKAFKFNANKVDAESVKSTVHVDAPALSTVEASVGDSSNLLSGISGGADATSLSGIGGVVGIGVDSSKSNEQWDDEAYNSSRTKKVTATSVTSTSTGTTELLDMKAFDPKRNNQDNIKEKLRVEENKALLENARKGMEREAQRIKDEQKDKEASVQKTTVVASRFAGAAANVGGGAGASGGKWIPPHMRGGGAGSAGGGLSRVRMGASSSLKASQKLDTQDENLFPDLASAAIIEKQQQSQQPAYMAPKKTPVGGGATWASKSLKKKGAAPTISKSNPSPSSTATTSSISSSKATVTVSVPETAEEKTTEPMANVAVASSVEKAEPVALDKEKTSTVQVASKPVKKTTKKKKKKDLSTFKPSS